MKLTLTTILENLDSDGKTKISFVYFKTVHTKYVPTVDMCLDLEDNDIFYINKLLYKIKYSTFTAFCPKTYRHNEKKEFNDEIKRLRENGWTQDAEVKDGY